MTSFPPWITNEAKKSKAAFRGLSSINALRDLENAGARTICFEALCPNKGECFKRGEATFLILGGTCTRNCAFCAVSKAKSGDPPDAGENERIAGLCEKWKLNYAVFTSPTRDDLPGGGASAFAGLNSLLKRKIPGIITEPLIPDFGGNPESLETVLSSGPGVLGHNIETVPSLYPLVRRGADYRTSLRILKTAKRINPQVLTKSALMAGLGESRREISAVLADLAEAGTDIVYVGQYLSPGKGHFPVKKYYRPEEFASIAEETERMGFRTALAGPFVRSSYKARQSYLRAACR